MIVIAKDELADRVVSGKRCGINRQGHGFESRVEIGNGSVIAGRSVIAPHDCGYSLAQHTGHVPEFVGLPVMMAVRIDEPRGKRQTLSINDDFSWSFIDIADRDDALGCRVKPHGTIVWGATRSVVNNGIHNQCA